MRIPALALLLVLPAFAGCLGADAPAPVTNDSVAATAADAGAKNGDAPSGPRGAFRVADDETQAEVAYPLALEGNAAKAPYTQSFEGVFEPQTCTPQGEPPLGLLGLAEGNHRYWLEDVFAKNDVFSFHVEMRWTNSEDNWADLHLGYRFDEVRDYYSEFTGNERGEVVLEFEGQGLIVSDAVTSVLSADCWYGAVQRPIPYVINLHVSFAEAALPSQAPVQFTVPDGATKLFVSGVAIDESRGVTSHFRVFRPDDSLLCECALNSDQATKTVELDTSGEHIVLVDHTDNGFVSLALDAANDGALTPLASQWESFVLAEGDGGPIQTASSFDVPSTPLGVWAWVFASNWPAMDPPGAGASRNLVLTITNARGPVHTMAMAGHVTWRGGVSGVISTNDWYPSPEPGTWTFENEHHNFDLGTHDATVQADMLLGKVVGLTRHYIRV